VTKRITTLPKLSARVPDGHKGLYGTVLIVAGGRGMAGAAGLAGAAALRSGAGLVRVASAAEVQPTVATFEPSYLTYPLENDADGFLRFEPVREPLKRLMASADVLAVGPGLGQSADLRALVRWLLETVELPVVLDADGLNALAGQSDLLERRKHPLVLTPHPGEFARITGETIAAVQADRAEQAVALAQKNPHLVVVLKGAGTVVTDGERVYVNTTGNPGMARGGSGDVLTGVISALIGQRLTPFDAAQLGVYLHGLAGDIARDQSGEIGMIAGDLVDTLPDAFAHLESAD
jgi:NAD(P)H-hydrate epimerase